CCEAYGDRSEGAVSNRTRIGHFRRVADHVHLPPNVGEFTPRHGPGARPCQAPGLWPYTYTSSFFFSSDQYFLASFFVWLTQPCAPGGFHMLTPDECQACAPSKNWL